MSAKENGPEIMSVLGIVPARRAVRVAAAPGQPAFPGFMYNGGAVVTSPVVYASFGGRCGATRPIRLRHRGSASTCRIWWPAIL